MSSTEIQIISKLFDFLGAYKDNELMAAASSPLVTANVRDALVALARARAEAPTAPTQAGSDTGSSNESRRALKMLETQLYSVLTDRDLAPSTADLAGILSRASIPIHVGTKDGRLRIVARVRRELQRLPPKEREQKLRQILRELRPNQTEGWFKVIRGEP